MEDAFEESEAAVVRRYTSTAISPFPERALPAADVLRTRMPGLGHLVHMPSH